MSSYSELNIQSDRKCCLYNEYFRRSEQGETYEFDSIGFKVWHFLSDPEFQGTIALPAVDDSILMCFCIDEEGDLQLTSQQRISFDAEQHNLIFLSNSKSAAFSVKNGKRLAVFSVLLKADVFFSYFPVNSTVLFKSFKQEVLTQKDVVLLSPMNFSINLEMKRVINSMLGSNREDECKHLYFKAKIIELLSLQLEQFMITDKPEGKKKRLKQDELDRVHEVKSVLEKNPEESYTLLGLARLVGTNDATLKKHFKMTFDTTVFNYLNRCRMEKAHLILQERDYKVSHVAEEVGFKYASHFSAAFKKHFGYSPAELKNADKASTSPLS